MRLMIETFLNNQHISTEIYERDVSETHLSIKLLRLNAKFDPEFS